MDEPVGEVGLETVDAVPIDWYNHRYRQAG
jgi:hypothetical protein